MARNLAGLTFGRLSVLRRVGVAPNHCVIWECRCQCGKIKRIQSTMLIRGRVQSCGCLRSDELRKRLRHSSRAVQGRYDSERALADVFGGPRPRERDTATATPLRVKPDAALALAETLGLLVVAPPPQGRVHRLLGDDHEPS